MTTTPDQMRTTHDPADPAYRKSLHVRWQATKDRARALGDAETIEWLDDLDAQAADGSLFVRPSIREQVRAHLKRMGFA